VAVDGEGSRVRTVKRLTHTLALSAGVFLVSCQGPEEQILAKYFDAVRSGDHVTLAGMSVAGFSGPVESWKIIEVGPESREPFRLPVLHQLSVETEEERDRQFYEFSEFREGNLAALNRIRNRLDEDPAYRFHGKWGEIQSEWEGFRERYEDLDLRRQGILREIDNELKLAKMSLMTSEEIDEFVGEVITKEVVLRIETAEGGERPYLFVLRKYDLTSNDGEFKPPSRWIITSIE
jgi:hypothetical protein